MSEGERFACWTGAILIGLGAWLMLSREQGTNSRRRQNQEAPVEVLAEELKDAWGEYHTP
ncbi:MAG: hypothetical protein ACR2JB_12585 [Bryobacteraceae bacterium]